MSDIIIVCRKYWVETDEENEFMDSCTQMMPK